MILTSQQTSILAVARAQRGKPYLYGAQGPNSYDCSGLTAFAFSHGAGIDIGAGTEGQLLKGTLVGANAPFGSIVSRMQACDIIFPSPTHCQLWTGTDVIEAANSSSPVHEVAEWAVPPYQPTVFQVRRYLIGPGTPVQTPIWQGRYLELTSPYMTGEDVRTWQRALIAAGHPCGVAGADGIYGRDTNAATVAWAAARGIPDSTEPWIVGPHNWQVMFG